jgi:transcription antitermination factor NusG
VIRGPLAGLAGILVRKKSKHRLVVSIDILQKSVSVEIDADSAVPHDW